MCGGRNRQVTEPQFRSLLDERQVEGLRQASAVFAGALRPLLAEEKLLHGRVSLSSHRIMLSRTIAAEKIHPIGSTVELAFRTGQRVDDETMQRARDRVAAKLKTGGGGGGETPANVMQAGTDSLRRIYGLADQNRTVVPLATASVALTPGLVGDMAAIVGAALPPEKEGQPPKFEAPPATQPAVRTYLSYIPRALLIADCTPVISLSLPLSLPRM